MQRVMASASMVSVKEQPGVERGNQFNGMVQKVVEISVYPKGGVMEVTPVTGSLKEAYCSNLVLVPGTPP